MIEVYFVSFGNSFTIFLLAFGSPTATTTSNLAGSKSERLMTGIPKFQIRCNRHHQP